MNLFDDPAPTKSDKERMTEHQRMTILCEYWRSPEWAAMIARGKHHRALITAREKAREMEAFMRGVC